MEIFVSLPDKDSKYLRLKYQPSDLVAKIKEEVLQIINRTISSQTETQMSSPTTPKTSAQSKIFAQTDVEDLILSYNGKLLDSQKSIDDYGIKEMTILHLSFKMLELKV